MRGTTSHLSSTPFDDATTQSKHLEKDFCEANDKSEHGMTENIIGTLSRRGISLDKLAFQSHEYASATSNQFKGAQ